MEYLVFVNEIREIVQKKCGDKMEVSIARVMRNNRNMVETLNIRAKGEKISPAFSVEQLYEKYQEEGNLESVADYILECYRDHFHSGNFDLSFFSEFSQVREYIVCRLVNYERNKLQLRQVPHTRYMDLAMLYYCNVECEIFGKGSILIQNSHLEDWGIGWEELHRTAVKNTLGKMPYELMSLHDIIRELTGADFADRESDEVPMYVLTNSEKYYGAVNLVFDGVLSEIGRKLRSDFYILPSSVHECMIVPVTNEFSVVQLHEMVQEINEEFVSEEEILGDSVYRYEREGHRLIMEKSA